MDTNERDPAITRIVNSSNRRDFLKRGGGATVATMLALHGTKSELLASVSGRPVITCGGSSGNGVPRNCGADGVLTQPAFLLGVPPGPGPTLGGGTLAYDQGFDYHNRGGGTVYIRGLTYAGFSSVHGLLDGAATIGLGSFIPQTAYGCNLAIMQCEQAVFENGFVKSVTFNFDTQVTVAATVWVTVKAGTSVVLHTGTSVPPLWGNIGQRTGFAKTLQLAYAQPCKANTSGLTPASTPSRTGQALIYINGSPTFDEYGQIITGTIPAAYSYFLPHCYDGATHHLAKVTGAVVFDRQLGPAPSPPPPPTGAPTPGVLRFGDPVGRYGLLLSGTSATNQTLKTGPSTTRTVLAGTALSFDPTTGWLI